MPEQVLTLCTVSVSELKANPQKAVHAGKGKPVAVLNHNKPEFYCVPPELFAEWHEILEDAELGDIINSRLHEKRHKVSPDEL